MKEVQKNATHWLTDDERNAVLKLTGCGLTNQDIADILHISYSSVAYIKQAYTACLDKDFDTLRRLSKISNPSVVWAMQVTGTSFPQDEVTEEEPDVQGGPEEKSGVDENIVTREFMLATFDALSDIRNLLTEIRDILK